MSLDGRRGQERFAVEKKEIEGRDALVVRGSDLTWINHLVESIHASMPQSEAHWRQDHPLDDAIVLVASKDELILACSELCEDIKSIAVDPHDCKVRLTGHRLARYSFANLVRRALMTRIPILAADSITVWRNDSSTQEEVLAHRIGQIALTFGPPQDGVLEVETDEDERIIVAGDIKFPSPVEVSPEDRSVPLGCLPPRSKITVTITTKVSIGLQHAKFAAVASVPVVPEIRFIERPSDDAIETLIAAGFVVDDQNRIVRLKEGEIVRMERIAEVLGCAPGELPVVNPPEAFTLLVEPLGQRTAEDCLQAAQNAILQEVTQVLECIQRSHWR